MAVEGTGDPWFARRLQAARRQAGLTQAELGHKIGRGQSTIAGYENADHMPAPKLIAALASALKVEEGVLLRGGRSEAPAASQRVLERILADLPRRTLARLGLLSADESAEIAREIAAFLEARLTSRPSRRSHRPK